MAARIRYGLVAGAVATIPMTIIILTGRRWGMFQTAPPEQISHNVAIEVGVGQVVDEPAFGPLWLALHVGFGAVCGAGYAAATSRRPAPVTSVAGGLGYGILIWAVNYLGVMPALGLFPPVRRAAWRRTTVMVLAHLVYGASLAQVLEAATVHG